MDNVVIYSDDNKPKDEVFGNLILCDEAYKNREDNQEIRTKELEKLIRSAKKIAVKYLCILNTSNEDCLSDLLDNELINLIVYQQVHYSEANNIIDVAGFLLHALNAKYHDYKDYELVV